MVMKTYRNMCFQLLVLMGNYTWNREKYSYYFIPMEGFSRSSQKDCNSKSEWWLRLQFINVVFHCWPSGRNYLGYWSKRAESRHHSQLHWYGSAEWHGYQALWVALGVTYCSTLQPGSSASLTKSETGYRITFCRRGHTIITLTIR